MGREATQSIRLYHNIPKSITKETPFTPNMRGRSHVLIEIDMSSWWCSGSNKEVNESRLRCVTDLINETREFIHIQDFSSKQREHNKYHFKVVPREI